MNDTGLTEAHRGPSSFAPGPSQERMHASLERFGARIRRHRRSLLAIVAGFALLGCACAIAGILAWQDIRATEALTDARRAQHTATLVLDAMLTAETAQRGYLLTRDPTYLENYEGAKDKCMALLAELRKTPPGGRSARNMAAVAANVGTEKFTELERTIDLAGAGRFDEAIAIVRSGSGMALMENFRHVVDGLIERSDEDVMRTAATESRVSFMLLGAIVIALLCVAGLAALLLKDAMGQFSLLESRETSARQLAETLERRVEQRTRELAEANQRFDAALRASGVTVMTQDRDLMFTWISRGIFGQSTEVVIGKPQQEVIPENGAATATNLKRSVIETGQPARGDIRITHDGAETWYDLTVHPMTDESGAVTGIIAGAVDITRYKEQEGRIRLLMCELTHRSKNLLTVIQAIMRQTAANSASIEDFETRFSARLQSLAGSHDLLVREDWQGASMRELVRSQLGHYIDRIGSQIVLTGEPMQIRPDAAQHIGMAMHELATNAAKYGALSTPDGVVNIAWHVSSGPDGETVCHLSWEESGGPPVERPSVRGFGRVVIERTVARAVHGEVRIEYAPSGLRWTLEFPERLADYS